MIKRKQTSLTLKIKYEILCLLDLGERQSILAKRYKISPSVVCSIKRQREEILKHIGEMPLSAQKVKKSSFNVIDEKLLEWFKFQREKRIPLNSSILSEKATQISKDLNVENFRCPPSWIERFKKRHKIKFSVISGEANSVNMKVVDDWLTSKWPELRSKYEERDIFNADETGLLFKALPSKTLAFQSDKCIGEKTSKERLTVYLCSSMIGEKRPAVIIGKYLKPRCFKNKNVYELNYYANANAWMKSEIFEMELIKWDKELRKNNDRKILLLVDNCTAHKDYNVILTNIRIEYFPSNTTSVLQPMDAGIIKNFKVYYRKHFVIELIQCIDNNAKFKPTVFDAIQMIDSAWMKVTSKTIQNCFSYAFKKIDKDDNFDIGINIDETDANISDIEGFFETRNDLINYIKIDDDVCTTGVENEPITVENIENCKEEPVIEIKIEDALKFVKLLKSFYYVNDNASKENYRKLLDIEVNLERRYCDLKKRQKLITDYFKIK